MADRPMILASAWVHWECDECGATGDEGPVDSFDAYDYDNEHVCEVDE